MTSSAVSSSPSAQVLLDSTWSSPNVVSTSTSRAVYPVVVADNENLVHVFWEQDNRIFYSGYQNGRWAGPRSIGTGQHPAAGLAADGSVHLVFNNEFGGIFNVFYIVMRNGVWTLPRLVSKTTGASTLPAMAIDGNGTIHAAWADTTPGYSVIYHGWLEETWLNEPLLNARGTAPALIQGGQHQPLHLAYQGSGISGGPREIFHLQGSTYAWSLPENLSVSPSNESSAATMACDTSGETHVVWQEQQGNQSQIRYVAGHRGNWSASERLSDAGVDARAPEVVVTQGNQVQAAWRQGNTIVYRRKSILTGQWDALTSLVSNPGGLGNPALAADRQGQLHMSWSGRSAFSERSIYYSRRAPVVRPQVFIPQVQAQ